MGLETRKRYWLTGAGNGVGAALAEAILKTGAHLAVSSRSSRSCEYLSAHYPGQVLAVPGNLTDSQTVREIGEQIARQWGSLDTVILNAGSAEYIDGQPAAPLIIEHIVRSNLMAASLCIRTALPLLRAGNMSHLVGIASPATYLPPSYAEADGKGMRFLFESARVDLAAKGIDVTLVHPGFDGPARSLDDCFPAPVQWTAETAAHHVLTQLAERPREVALPVSSMTALWPLPSSPESMLTDVNSNKAGNGCPIKGQP
ncbi:SDR family NAD(P)-dependent oxidoreductase [Pseudomonas hefeiensis]|uniref:SDR family NAD(P)-dependent oxidoreductase n=1 Tax=Pseudomonas hefeiensis TaxID=2738125 RepID=A0ABY9G8Q2_9PSED|nr:MULTISPECIES: SDR family oxidoreductase [unclassified Pseudomonas]WLH11889.1 SDR family NAD(P)-dependent oxidoreductase [Pseudomonas sp. FP205]WLH94946.1 SDR family NAD(P)-dependent oxidoreductase [Pseudomonas sp. FP53]WLI39233.1 SDR family NAD(P)-dependent oxidoreductase [Pseudomonas sp. FP821]